MTRSEPLARRILIDGLTDWVEFDAATRFTAQLVDDDQARPATLFDTLTWMVESRWIEIGDLSADEPGTFVAWPGPVTDAIRALAKLYRPGQVEPETWFYACWLSNTAEGDRIAEGLRDLG